MTADFRLNQQVPCSFKYIRGGRKEASRLVIVMVYERQFNYHLWNSYGVLAGIGTVSLANWALPITDVGTRLSLDITLLLVAVAFKQVLSAELPPVSYLTILDRYSLAIIGFVFLATWLHGFVGLLEFELDYLSSDQVKHLDLITIVIYTLGFVMYNAWHVALVRTQLFFNDARTDKQEISVHGFSSAQMGQVNAAGRYEKVDVNVNSVYGRYANRPSAAESHEVIPVMRLLATSIWEGHTTHTETRDEYHRRALQGEGGFIKLVDEEQISA